ncbi:hypothetical protein HERIO_193 [Hepatospora eriocheir]|uniref:Ricin B lectin domain-containing protein n=1 Tax=Hepatospora eriocheir TaxID=1081669 RepID=A0A1X0QDU0_9MICR|nr:hypothetical protein HERIO_193 [Hepatospora eriocheir]
MFLFDFMLKFMITIIVNIVRCIKFQEINTGMFIALDNSKEPKLILKNKLNEGANFIIKSGLENNSEYVNLTFGKNTTTYKNSDGTFVKNSEKNSRNQYFQIEILKDNIVKIRYLNYCFGVKKEDSNILTRVECNEKQAKVFRMLDQQGKPLQLTQSSKVIVGNSSNKTVFVKNSGNTLEDDYFHLQ